MSSVFQFQDQLCSWELLKCVTHVKVDTSICMKPCSGMLITSFTKTEHNKNLEDVLPSLDQYNTYKKVTQYPSGFDGTWYLDYVY